MTEKPRRLDWVDTGRGIAIVLVVLYHSTSWLSGTGLDLEVWTDVNTVLSSARMPMFFALAGLFAGKWLVAPWSALLRTKILLFGWVFLVWETIGTFVVPLGLASADQPVNFTGLVFNLAVSPVLPRFELWFIWALMLFFVVAKATHRVPPSVQLVLAGLLSAAALTIWLTKTTGLTGSAKFYFFFLAGIYLRSWIIGYGSLRARWPLVAAFVAWATISVSFFVFDIRALPGMYFVNCVVGVLGGIAASRALSRLSLLGRLGRQTLPIYLAHTPIVIMLAFAVSLPPLFTVASALTPLMPLLGTAIAITGAYWLHRFAQRNRLRYLYEPPMRAIDALTGSLPRRSRS